MLPVCIRQNRLKRYRRRCKIERLFAWLQNCRRLVVRYERHAENFLGILQLASSLDAQTCRLIVLDRRILSMTEFKQIIGRGTRINEDYNKLYFTIMDFKRATVLFADPNFDGDPVQIFEPGPGDDPVPPDDLPDPDELVQAEGFNLGAPDINIDDGGERRTRYYVDDVEVSVATERVQYLDADGRLITESLSDYPTEVFMRWLVVQKI